MTARKRAAAKNPPVPTAEPPRQKGVISDVAITGNSISMQAAPANEHTSACIVGIAKALEENARSCGEVARAIAKSGGVFNGHGMSFNVKE